MTQFLNSYTCPQCDYEWEDEWDCGVDDDCPECGKRQISPTDSTELEGWTMSDHEISKMLTLSTAHVPQETARNLDHRADGAPFDLPVTFSKRDYGWFICCGEHDDETGWPDELAACIAYARALGCDWLCLDSDGPVMADLPTFDW